jgi:hypothetical protein
MSIRINTLSTHKCALDSTNKSLNRRNPHTPQHPQKSSTLFTPRYISLGNWLLKYRRSRTNRFIIPCCELIWERKEKEENVREENTREENAREKRECEREEKRIRERREKREENTSEWIECETGETKDQTRETDQRDQPRETRDRESRKGTRGSEESEQTLSGHSSGERRGLAQSHLVHHENYYELPFLGVE